MIKIASSPPQSEHELSDESISYACFLYCINKIYNLYYSEPSRNFKNTLKFL